MPRRRLHPVVIVAIAGGSALLCCGGVLALASLIPSTAVAPKATTAAAEPKASTDPPGTTAPPPPLTSAAAPASTAPPDRQICRVTDGAGSYYLYVTSATDHDFRACTGAVAYSGTIDGLLNLPGMDRRCILGAQYTAIYNAIVGVYSDTKTANLAAARRYCVAHGGE